MTIELVKRLTFNSLTPSSFLTALSTLAEQAAQLIPVIKYFSPIIIFIKSSLLIQLLHLKKNNHQL